jgi:hypothetical protein
VSLFPAHYQQQNNIARTSHSEIHILTSMYAAILGLEKGESERESRIGHCIRNSVQGVEGRPGEEKVRGVLEAPSRLR